MIDMVTVAVLSLMPFVMIYGAYEGPKVWWMWGIGLFLSLRYAYLLWRNKLKKIPARARWLLVWIIVLTVASLFGVHPIDSIVGGSYRHQGVLFFFTLFLIVLAMTGLTDTSRRLLIRLAAMGTVGESLFVLWQKYTAWNTRPLGTFGEPNAVAGYLAVGLFWIWQVRPLYSIWKAIGSIAVVAAIWATDSRSGMGAVVVVIVGIVVSFLRVSPKKSKKIVLFGSIAGVTILTLIVGFTVLGVSAARPASAYENRPLFWTMAVRAITTRPVLGYGAESGEAVFQETFRRNNIRLFDFVIERSHNIILDVAMWSGLVGLIVFGRWIWSVVTELTARRKYDRLFALLAWFFFAFLQPLGAVHWVQLMMLVGVSGDVSKKV